MEIAQWLYLPTKEGIILNFSVSIRPRDIFKLNRIRFLRFSSFIGWNFSTYNIIILFSSFFLLQFYSISMTFTTAANNPFQLR